MLSILDFLTSFGSGSLHPYVYNTHLNTWHHFITGSRCYYIEMKIDEHDMSAVIIKG